ncbi:MAG TPA: hypothetical protein VFW87_06000 [Pirellulales bacterium]|nr:hypothetical protein [Pirellulales bacterium]
MARPLQFSLNRLLAATAMAAVGMAFLLRSTGPLLWFAMTITFSGASFGAALGFLFDRVGRFLMYGMIAAIVFVAYAWAT